MDLMLEDKGSEQEKIMAVEELRGLDSKGST